MPETPQRLAGEPSMAYSDFSVTTTDEPDRRLIEANILVELAVQDCAKRKARDRMNNNETEMVA